MTRERAKELLPVIQAYAEGKPIQWKSSSGVWHDDVDFDFQLSADCYRIKPEPKYRPFKNCDELIATWRKMVGYSAKPNTMPLIWVKTKDSGIDGYTSCITGFSNSTMTIIETDVKSLLELFEDYTFLDGSPFGVAE